MVSRMNQMEDSKVLQDMEDLFRVDNDPSRGVLERTWLRNILYYMGEQWLAWYESTGFGKRFELGIDEPTPVSNMVRDYVRSMKAMILNKGYVIKVWPNSSEQKDKDAASLGEQILRWMDSLDDMEVEDVKELTALWTVLTGNGFPRTVMDPEAGGYSVNSKGELLISKGQVVVDNIIPFNVMVPWGGTRLKDKTRVGIKSLKPKEWVEDTFGVKVVAADESSEIVNYQKQLMTLVANVSPWKGRGFESTTPEMKNEDLVLYKEVEYRPTKDYPEGRYNVAVGNQVIVKDSKMLVPVDKEGRWSYSIDHIQYNHTPGAFWASGGVDDQISPQNTVNEVDRALAINRKSLGRPMVLSPAELTLRRLSARGDNILVLEYDALTAGGARPDIRRGVPYPNQILDERKLHREVAQEAAGDPKNILRGQSPHSGASGLMVDILRETAEQSHSPDVKRFYRRWNGVNRKRLILAQRYYTESRILKVPGAGSQILVKGFKGADINGNTDVRLELDSGVASTNSGKTQFLMELVKYNFFGDVNARPGLQRDLMRRFGLAGLEEEQSIHSSRAEIENSILLSGDETELNGVALPNQPIQDQTGKPIPAPYPNSHDPVFRMDPHPLHIQVHDRLIFSREFRNLKADIQRIIIMHRDMHMEAWKIQLETERQRAIQESAAMGGGGVSKGISGPSSGGGGGSSGSSGGKVVRRLPRVDAGSEGPPRPSAF